MTMMTPTLSEQFIEMRLKDSGFPKVVIARPHLLDSKSFYDDKFPSLKHNGTKRDCEEFIM